MKKIKDNLDLFIFLIIGFVMSCSTVFAATILYQSSETGYDNTSTGLTSNNVQTAIDELYDYCTGTLAGTAWDFSYSGEVEPWTVPYTGTYKLEVWGAQGGKGTYDSGGGKGGYSIGNVYLTKGTIIYIVVGGQSDGYNGGGSSGRYCGKGGGATHIATETGTLEHLYAASNNNANTAKSKIYIVAGGGGGSYQSGWPGGTGGGTSGTTGGKYVNYGDAGGGSGGTQSSGNAFGKGGNGTCEKCGGGGGGLYGGGAAWATGDGGGGGGGGSGYLNTTLLISGTTSMTNGVREGNGTAKITYLGA